MIRIWIARNTRTPIDWSPSGSPPESWGLSTEPEAEESKDAQQGMMTLAHEWVSNHGIGYCSDVVECMLVCSEEEPDADFDPEEEEFVGMQFWVNKNNSSGIQIESDFWRQEWD